MKFILLHSVFYISEVFAQTNSLYPACEDQTINNSFQTGFFITRFQTENEWLQAEEFGLVMAETLVRSLDDSQSQIQFMIDCFNDVSIDYKCSIFVPLLLEGITHTLPTFRYHLALAFPQKQSLKRSHYGLSLAVNQDLSYPTYFPLFVDFDSLDSTETDEVNTVFDEKQERIIRAYQRQLSRQKTNFEKQDKITQHHAYQTSERINNQLEVIQNSDLSIIEKLNRLIVDANFRYYYQTQMDEFHRRHQVLLIVSLSQLPMLSYLSSSYANEVDVIRALDLILKNNKLAHTEIQEKFFSNLLQRNESTLETLQHFLSYYHLTNQILSEKPEFCSLVYAIQNHMKYKNQRMFAALTPVLFAVSIVPVSYSVLALGIIEAVILWQLDADYEMAARSFGSSLTSDTAFVQPLEVMVKGEFIFSQAVIVPSILLFGLPLRAFRLRTAQ